MAVGMRNESPGEAEHPRIAGERAIDQLRQLAVIAGRQGGVDFTDLPLDEVIVVDQPFGGGGDGAARLDRGGDGAVGFEQGGGVVCEASGQCLAPGRLWCDRLGRREAAGVLLPALDAE